MRSVKNKKTREEHAPTTTRRDARGVLPAGPRLRVIGLIVSKLGIQVNPDRLQAITEFQMPKTKTAVRRLLGMANQYRNHIYRYAKIVDPLCRLTEGEWPTRWDSESVPEECHTVLEKLKTALTSPAVLSKPDPKLPFEVHMDFASE